MTKINLDMNSNYHFSPNYGLFDTMTLSAKFDCSYSQFRQDSQRDRPDKPLTEVLKTTLHETTHLYQMLTTPYGMYYYTLKGLQTDLVRHLIIYIKENYQFELKLPLKMSLWKFCEQFKLTKDFNEVWQLLHAFVLAEFMICYLEDDVDYLVVLQKYSYLNGKTASQCFESLEFYVTQYLNSYGKPCELTHYEMPISKETLASELQYIGLRVTGISNTNGIMETWAKVSEYWGDQNLLLKDCPNLFPPVIKPDLIDYYILLEMAAHGLNATTVGEFILSYMAMCEIALSPPLLPYYSSLRHENFSFREINPVQRMFDIQTAVHGIRPIQNLEEDYLRFTREVCDKLGWVTPTKIAEHTVEFFKFPQNDFLSEIYYESQLLRQNIPQVFIDLGVWFAPERIYTKEFMYYFTHPIIIFNDEVLHHSNRDMVFYFTMQSLLNNFMRRILVASKQEEQSVIFPYKTSQTELDVYADFLASIVEGLCGVRPSVNLINPD